MQSQSVAAEPEPASRPGTEDVRSHLRRVLESPKFSGAPRLARFLEFVVETALEGKADEIKESLIAVEVYGRPPDYNPQIDSTVRVEARRLRTRLIEYYGSVGLDDGIQIELPKGTYAPVFRRIAACKPAPAGEIIPEPVGVVPGRPAFRKSYAVLMLVAAAGVFLVLFWSVTKKQPAAIDSLAVLPLVNLSKDKLTDQFCDGLTEEVTTLLARDGRVPVASRTTMAQYEDRTADVSGIGKAHRVRAVLEGSVRRDGDKLVVTTQLIDTANGYSLWADRFEREEGPVAGVQTEVASRVVTGVRHALSGREAQAQADSKTTELYHRAHDLLRIPVHKDGPPRKLPDSVTESVRLFREATSRSPRFAKAWAGLAEAAEWEYELGGNQPAERLAEARAAAERAVKLQPDLTDGWTILTSILLFREWDIEGAEAACRRVMELDPRNTSARERLAGILRIQGRRKDAWTEIEAAIQLLPAAASLRVRKARMLFEDGEYDRGIEEARAAARLTNTMPAYPMALWVEGLCQEQKGKLAAAEKAFRAGMTIQPHDLWNAPALAHMLGRAKRAGANEILADLQQQLKRGRKTHVAQALIYLGLGRTEEALRALESGWRERDDAMLLIGADPRFRPLASHRAFEGVLARLPGPDANQMTARGLSAGYLTAMSFY